MAQLSLPAEHYKTSFCAAVSEFQQEGSYTDYQLDWLDTHFDWLVNFMLNKRTNPKPGSVPETVFWLVEGYAFIGRVSLRHELNDDLRQFGGHIGYEIRPSERRKGYGMLICKLALDEARKIGLHCVMITCDEDNLASRKIIEANGGKLENAVQLEGRSSRTLHFWVELDKEPKS